MSLNYCKNNLILTWSANFLILSNAAENQGTTFAIADNKLRVPVVTLSTGGYAKLIHQLKWGFKCTINWKNINQKQNNHETKNFYYLIDASFQRTNKLFVLLFENNVSRTVNTKYFSNYKNKRSWCYDWWKKLFWSTSKEHTKHTKDC